MNQNTHDLIDMAAKMGSIKYMFERLCELELGVTYENYDAPETYEKIKDMARKVIHIGLDTVCDAEKMRQLNSFTLIMKEIIEEMTQETIKRYN